MHSARLGQDVSGFWGEVDDFMLKEYGRRFSFHLAGPVRRWDHAAMAKFPRRAAPRHFARPSFAILTSTELGAKSAATGTLVENGGDQNSVPGN